MNYLKLDRDTLSLLEHRHNRRVTHCYTDTRYYQEVFTVSDAGIVLLCKEGKPPKPEDFYTGPVISFDVQSQRSMQHYRQNSTMEFWFDMRAINLNLNLPRVKREYGALLIDPKGKVVYDPFWLQYDQQRIKQDDRILWIDEQIELKNFKYKWTHDIKFSDGILTNMTQAILGYTKNRMLLCHDLAAFEDEQDAILVRLRLSGPDISSFMQVA